MRKQPFASCKVLDYQTFSLHTLFKAVKIFLELTNRFVENQFFMPTPTMNGNKKFWTKQNRRMSSINIITTFDAPVLINNQHRNSNEMPHIRWSYHWLNMRSRNEEEKRLCIKFTMRDDENKIEVNVFMFFFFEIRTVVRNVCVYVPKIMFSNIFW